jgi:DNA polymerase III subunit delta'
VEPLHSLPLDMGFESFLGNEKAVTSVRGMLASGSVPGALLFAGPDGVGKKTLALMLAKALNCERLRDDYCGECRRCRKAGEMIRLSREDLARRRDIKDSGRRVEGLIYFDVQLIEPLTRFILIEQIRQLRNAAYTRPFELQHRVFILDQAQTVHWQAVDLLLKVLEEPPETSRVILICPNLHQLKATLRSRCQRVPFQPVGDSVLEEMLRKGNKVPAAQLRLATRIAAGSIASAGELNVTEFQSSRQPWIDFLNGITAKNLSSMTPGDWKIVFDSSKSLADSRNELEAALRIGYSLLADILQILETGSDERVVNLDLTSRLRGWAGKLGFEGINRLTAGLDSTYRLQTRNINQQLGWEALATELIARG